MHAEVTHASSGFLAASALYWLLVRKLSKPLLAFLLLGLPGVAHSAAPESKLQPVKYDARFEALPFDQGPDELIKAVEGMLQTSNRDRVREATDPHDRDRIQAELAGRVQAFRDSFIEFKGQKTGYNVSVVSGDFAHNAGEAMMVAPVGRSNDYFFFIRGALWKLVTTEVTKQSFPAFLVNLTQLYGAPSKVEYRDPDGKTDPVRAHWQDGDFSLEVRARPEYGAITLSWSRRTVETKLPELRGAAKPPGSAGGTGLDPSILDIMKD